MGFFATHTVTIKHSDGTVVATGKPLQMDPANLPLQMQGEGLVPVDIYDCESIGWSSPVPLRSDYIVDQNGTQYSMFSTVFRGLNSLQFQVSKYTGATP